MNRHNFDSNVSMPGSAFKSQNQDVDTAIEVLQAMKEDMTEDAVERADVEAVIKMAEVYKNEVL